MRSTNKNLWGYSSAQRGSINSGQMRFDGKGLSKPRKRIINKKNKFGEIKPAGRSKGR
jgi:hypothetical protein